MHMVWHQVPFQNLAFLLACQTVEDLPQLTTHLPKDGFPSPLGDEHDVVLAVPFGVG
jgi:hypothetical protein